MAQKNRNAELRAGSLSGDARLVTDIKYINKNIYKSIHATQIEFLYFLYIAFTDYYSTAPCIRQITQRTQGIQLFPSVAGKLFYFLPPGASILLSHSLTLLTSHLITRNTSKSKVEGPAGWRAARREGAGLEEARGHTQGEVPGLRTVGSQDLGLQ